MKYTVEALGGYLRAEMRERENAAETREFVAAILAAIAEHKLHRVLISIRESRAIFKVEDWKLSEALEQAIRMAAIKVAFIADSAEESDALAWLLAD